MADRGARLRRGIFTLQGAYYTASGVWPLASMDTFELVTGPKADRWLVEMVGLLLAVIGIVLLHAVRARRLTQEIALLAFGSALSFAAIDLIYATGGRISAIYLADVPAQAVFAVAAAWETRAQSRQAEHID